VAAHRSAGVTLHRFFLPPSAVEGTAVRFPPEVSHQIARVLRLDVGERVIVLDGSGREWTVRLDGVRGVAHGTIEERTENQAEPRIRLVLYQGMVKGSKFETIVQKCTEIGVSRFVPMLTARAVASDINSKRYHRFEAIAREAAEQSGRGRVPPVERPITFEEAVRRATHEGTAVLLWEGERSRRLAGVAAPAGGSAALLVGPEGGFTDAEAREGRDAGAHVVTLGPRILRSETAAIVGSALLLAHLESRS